MVDLKSGEVKWFNAGFTHSLMNPGKSAAKFVTLEFPPPASTAR
jgi:mannose-6-phosphate isomerase-like protein (cupin superfamily)